MEVERGSREDVIKTKLAARGSLVLYRRGCMSQGSFKWEENGFCLESSEGMCSTDTSICVHYTHLRWPVSTDVEQTLM